MRKIPQLIFILICIFLLSACGLVDFGDVNVDTSEVESFVEDVSEDLGIGATRTPTPEGGPTATPTRTPLPPLRPTFTPGASGPIQTGAGPSVSGSNSSLPPRVPIEVELSGETYTVEAGDTLGEIATLYGVSLDALISANSNLVNNENVIEIGWVLQIPK